MYRMNSRAVLCIVVMLIAGTIAGCKKQIPTPDGNNARTQQGGRDDAGKRDEIQVVEKTDLPANKAASSEFHEGVKIKVGDQPIDFEVGHLVPCVVDWNNDGSKDLIVGQFSGGAINLFLNEGTDAEPVFKESVKLQAGDKPISLDAG